MPKIINNGISSYVDPENIVVTFSNIGINYNITSLHNVEIYLNIFNKSRFRLFEYTNSEYIDILYFTDWIKCSDKYSYSILYFKNKSDIKTYMNKTILIADTYNEYMNFKSVYDNYDDFLTDYIDRIKNMKKINSAYL